MRLEASNFSEQAINKVAEIAIARQLQEVRGLEVQIKTDLTKLAKGQIDAIAINIQGLWMQHCLRAAEFHLQMGQVAVKPWSAIRGKIQLAHPSTGTLLLVIEETGFTHALNTEPWMRSRQPDITDTNSLSPVECHLTDGAIVIQAEPLHQSPPPPFSVTTTPQITNDKEIDLFNIHDHGEPPSPQFANTLTTQIKELLSLRDIQSQGTSLQIQQIAIASGRLTIHADIYIQEFSAA